MGVLSDIGKLGQIEADPALVSRFVLIPNQSFGSCAALADPLSATSCNRNEIKRAFQQEHIEMLMGTQALVLAAQTSGALSHQQTSVAESAAAQLMLSMQGTAPSPLMSRGLTGVQASEPAAAQPTSAASPSPSPAESSEPKVMSGTKSLVPEPPPLPGDQNMASSMKDHRDATTWPATSVLEKGLELSNVSPFLASQQNQQQEGSDVQQPLIQSAKAGGTSEAIGEDLLQKVGTAARPQGVAGSVWALIRLHHSRISLVDSRIVQ